MSGRLFLVPSRLGDGAPDAVLPERTIAIARGLVHYVVENAKPARQFLKAIGATRPLREIAIVELPERATPAQCRELLAPALAGHDVGLLSDAGCPAVADPGARLVAAAHDERILVVPLVGPSSLLLALMASGMNGQGFAFHGYLPVKADARAAALRRIEADSGAHRLRAALHRDPVPDRRDAGGGLRDVQARDAAGIGGGPDPADGAQCVAARSLRGAATIRRPGPTGPRCSCCRPSGAVRPTPSPFRAVRARRCGGGRDAAADGAVCRRGATVPRRASS